MVKKVYPLIEEGLFDNFKPQEPRTPELLVHAGFGTAIIAIMNSLFVIPEAYRAYQADHPEIPNKQKSPKISINNLVNALAQGSQGISPSLLRALAIEKPPKPYMINDGQKILFSVFDPKYFQIKEKEGALVLDTKDGVLDTLPSPSNPYVLLKNRPIIRPLIGCPAMYTPAIRELMAWSEKLYTRYGLPQAGEPEKTRRRILRFGKSN